MNRRKDGFIESWEVPLGRSEMAELRAEYHAGLCREILGHRKGTTVFSVADTSSSTSVDLAARVVKAMGHPTCPKPPEAQKAGSLFGRLTLEFLQKSFEKLRHLRPGEWKCSATQTGIRAFDQYEHLEKLDRVFTQLRELAAALGGDYLITPDIIVARYPVSDDDINEKGQLVSWAEHLATHTPLRRANFKQPWSILHRLIWCKWTMRSDRAQNSRTEALNLIRNRKGRTPHIVAVTMEPLPTRLASIAMGTGDVDCTYHAALHELEKAVKGSGNEDQAEMLGTLVSGRRLRDISDLPFDLAA